MKKLSIILMVIILVASFLVGCTPKESGPEVTPPVNVGEKPADTPSDTPAKDTLVVAMGAEPSTLDGNGKNDSASLQPRTQIYETLVTQDYDMTIIPAIAESWDYTDDVTLVFKIREGVKFHNGEELKASDVEFSLKRGSELGFTGNYLTPIDFEKSGATGDYEYTMVLKEPFSAILPNITSSSSAIVPEKVVLEEGPEYLAKNPIGTGPYKLKEWFEGDRIELVKNDDYWKETKGVKNIVMRFISENASRGIEVEVGGVDIAYDLAPNDTLRFEGNDDVVVSRVPSLSTTYVGFNYSKDIFKDKKIRQAIAHAVDMPSIVEAVYFGLGIPGTNMITPKVWGFTDKAKPITYDVELAKELMAEAGYADGFKTTIWTSDNQQRMDIAEIMANQLQQIGIEADVKVIEWGTFLVALQNKELDIYILGIGAPVGDAGEALYSQFHSTSPFSGNTGYYSNSEVDRLLEAGRRSIIESERLEILEELQLLLMEELPWVPVWHSEISMGLGKDVKGFESHPTGNHRLVDTYFE